MVPLFRRLSRLILRLGHIQDGKITEMEMVFLNPEKKGDSSLDTLLFGLVKIQLLMLKSEESTWNG